MEGDTAYDFGDAFIRLSSVVNGTHSPVPPSLRSPEIEAIVSIKGGLLQVEVPSTRPYRFFRGNGDPIGEPMMPHLQVGIKAQPGEQITCTGEDVCIVIKPGQELVIGHHDLEAHAFKREITGRDCTPQDGTPFRDVDFAWLYPLIGIAPDDGPLLTLVTPTGELSPALTTPFTSTCFGALWP